MYSQYNQYQQSGGGSALTSTTTQSGLTWNGTAWVPSATTTPTSTTSTHSSYSTTTSNKPAAELVQQYTQYYHLWKTQQQEQERLAQSLPEGHASAKETHQRQAQWYKHYSDQSSIAAHHYHNTPHAAPPALPPVPPGAVGGGTTTTTAGTVAFQQAQQQQQQQHVTQQPSVAAQVVAQPVVQQQHQQQHSPESPDGLKRYVHKCLQQCQGKDELQRMQKEVETVIAQAIRDGTMHSTNWDAKPLLPVDTATAVKASGGTAAAVKKFKQQSSHERRSSSSPQQPNASAGYYGPSNTLSDVGANQGGNYYGPSSSNSRSHDDMAHYGPSSSGDASYYGPSPTSATSNDDYYGNSSAEDKYKNKWSLQDKFPANATPSDFVSSDNYYGNNSSKGDLGDDDSHSISRKRKKKDKTSKKKIKVKKEVIMQTPRDGLDRSSSALAKRANRFAGAGGISEAASLPTSTSSNMDRFMGLALIGGSKKLDEEDYEQMKVKGTCTKFEKDYLRLTAPPRAELVRPEEILKMHLENLKVHWTSPKHKDYIWFCSQLKAVRQDLTVQQIANAFAVDVYETHARIALEEGDLNEYNQCQTQLKELYKKLQGDKEAIKNENEFVALRLIYYVFLQGNKKYQGGSSDMFNIMLSLSPEQRQDSLISHALKVRVAVADHDYHAFFRLLKECPKHGTYLMSKMVPKVRHSALQRMCKAYRPSVSTNHVLQELGFDVEKEAEFGRTWLASCGVVLSENGNDVLAKDSTVRESDLTEKASSLI